MLKGSLHKKYLLIKNKTVYARKILYNISGFVANSKMRRGENNGYTKKEE